MKQVPDATDWAWFAGLFEGEGYIGFAHTYSVYLVLEMNDEDVVRRAHEIAGGTISSHRRSKVIWRWKANNQHDVRRVLDNIEQHLGERRSKKVREARERLSQIRPYTPTAKGRKRNATTG